MLSLLLLSPLHLPQTPAPGQQGPQCLQQVPVPVSAPAACRTERPGPLTPPPHPPTPGPLGWGQEARSPSLRDPPPLAALLLLAPAAAVLEAVAVQVPEAVGLPAPYAQAAWSPTATGPSGCAAPHAQPTVAAQLWAGCQGTRGSGWRQRGHACTS